MQLAPHFGIKVGNNPATYRDYKTKNLDYSNKKKEMITSHLNGLWTDQEMKWKQCENFLFVAKKQ